MFCWACHVECRPLLYCPDCGTWYGPFYHAEKPHAPGTPIPPEPRITEPTAPDGFGNP